jgi:hypothetical protein
MRTETRQRVDRLLPRALRAFGLAGFLAMTTLAQGLEQKVLFHIDGKVGAEVVRKGSYVLIVPEAMQGTAEIKVGKRTISIAYSKQVIETPAGSDRVTYKMNEDGSRSVATITPKGQKFTLVIGS